MTAPGGPGTASAVRDPGMAETLPWHRWLREEHGIKVFHVDTAMVM